MSMPHLTVGHNGRKLARLEDRLSKMATRQEIDNLSDLNCCLDDIHALLSSSVTGPGGCQRAIEKSVEDVKSLIECSDKKALKTIENMLENAIQAMKSDILNELKDAVKEILNNTEKKDDGPISKVDKINATEVKEAAVDPKPTTKEPALSCMDLYKNGERQSGVYAVSPVPCKPSIQVYCDMETDDGGWTVFQRRQDRSVDFYRDWDEYASGFGDLDGEFWLGNTHTSDMTSECCHELRIELGDFEGNLAFVKYSSFKVFPENDNFRLEFGDYSGNATDSLGKYHNGSDLSTKDRDNDQSDASHCARKSKGAWWYDACHWSHLNGEYLVGEHESSVYEGLTWYHWKDWGYSLKYTEMKFRPLLN